jgi:hypothetical protein
MSRPALLPAFLAVLLLAPAEGARAQAGAGEAASTGGAAAVVVLAPPADSSVVSFRPGRFWVGVSVVAGLDAAALYGFTYLWYRDRASTSFHWVNDWHESVQQDKLGHLVTAWHLARVFGAFGRWSGRSRQQAGLFGGAGATAFQAQIEIFDAFAVAWGASWGDLLANAVGGAAGGLQVAYPDLNWFTVKYSYHRSPYYDDRYPFVGNALKDYDGITYWLVVRPERVLPGAAARRWPDWLALAAGYGGDGLAHPSLSGGAYPEHRRELYLALDLDVAGLSGDLPSPFREIADALSFLHLPAPALQLTPGVRWYWIFY